MTEITPFDLQIPERKLSDLNRRLDETRWPECETVDDWSQGAPLEQIQALCDYWRNQYDWRRCETMLNGFGQFRAKIDGLDIHFLHVRSPQANALPLLITHGWPGSVIEFHKVIGPLTDPASHGGDPADAFHLVIPSLPGYGFSEKPSETGWGIERIAQAWVTLMQRIGYTRYVAQGGDWGASVTTKIGAIMPPEYAAIHLNMPLAFPTENELKDLNADEEFAVEQLSALEVWGLGYARQQSTRPQTLGYGLSDSPIGQAAWIFEKMHAWTDCDGDPTSILSMDEMLDNIMLYWLTGTGASSARLYWESFRTAFLVQDPIDMPTGCSIFPKESFCPSRRWTERVYPNLVYWNKPDRGGHFAAFEQPELFTDELRNCFRGFR